MSVQLTMTGQGPVRLYPVPDMVGLYDCLSQSLECAAGA